MRELSRASQIFILSVISLGGVLALWCLRYLELAYPVALFFAFALATLFQTLKIEGPTARSSYSLSWVVYAAVFASMGWPEMLLTIMVAHLGEWFRHRYPWYIQSFNIAVYAITSTLAGRVYEGWIVLPFDFRGARQASALFVAMLVFTLINHLMVGLVIKLARNQGLRESGVFAPTTLAIDFGLLCLGVSAAIVLQTNVAAIIFIVVVAITLLMALRMPALERETERIAEVARAAQAKYEFVATMNHELRTPLNAVLLYSESLERKLVGPLNERQARAARGILESAQHLVLIINDILDVAKIDANKLSLEITSTDVERVCQSSLLLVSGMAQKKELTLHYQRSPDVTHIQADEQRLKQMLVNLLGNAIKFTPEGGQVGLEVRAEVTSKSEPGMVYFTVWDTGIGIAQENLAKLFQPFVQLKVNHAQHQGGTGLGLFLVHRMAVLHGGSVSVTSEFNRGSRFTISLPWRKAQHATTATSHASVVPVHRDTPTEERDRVQVFTTHAEDFAATTVNVPAARPDHQPSVLIADDHKANRQVLSDLLQNWDCRILIARTGIEAVLQAKAEHPNLIFMDIQMPEMDGMEAMRQIRAEPSLERIPIIVLTAFATPEDREASLAAGANDYLSKPLQIEQLSSVLDTYIGGTPIKERL